MNEASHFGDAGYGAGYPLLCNLLVRMRHIANRWQSVTDGDCSFGSTARAIRILLDEFPDGTVFQTEEVQEWMELFTRLHKRAKKRLPKRISLKAYFESVMEDLKVIEQHSTNFEEREQWEAERDMHVLEFAGKADWVKKFRKEYRERT